MAARWRCCQARQWTRAGQPTSRSTAPTLPHVNLHRACQYSATVFSEQWHCINRRHDPDAAFYDYYAIREPERASRCSLGSDDCVIDRTSFFVRGCLENLVHGADEPLIWGVCVSLNEQSFKAWLKVFEQEHRSYVGPFFGCLNAWLKSCPDTMDLKTRVHATTAFGHSSSLSLQISLADISTASASRLLQIV